MKKNLLATFLLGINLAWATAQVVPQKHKITFNLKNLKDDTCMLVNYFGDKQYVQDTAVASGGKAVFRTAKGIPAGMYMFVQNRQRMFDFLVVDQETEFSINSDLNDLVGKMKISGSIENELFFEYLSYLDSQRKKADVLNQELRGLSKTLATQDSIAKKKNKKSSADSTEFKKKRDALIAVDADVKNYIKEFTQKNKDFFVGRFVKSTQDIEIPAPPKSADGKQDPAYPYHYAKAHYWDNYNLNDERLVYAPLFHSKLMNYLDNMIVPVPDSIKRDVNALIRRVEPNKELFKYITFVTTQRYETSQTMGMDAVFVDLVENYYNTKKAYWVDSVTLIKYKERAKQLSYTLIGRKVPNVIMQDSTVYRSYSLHDVKAKYTIVFIWDPGCGHCQHDTPVLVDFYNKNKAKYNLEVYAIGTGFSEMQPWQDFIKKNKMPWINVADLYNKTNYHYLFDIYSTPVILVLDEQKNILAKRIGVDQIPSLLEFEEKRLAAKAEADKNAVQGEKINNTPPDKK